MKRSPLLSWLSRETAEMHRQLESAPLLSKLLDDSISIEEVIEVLDRFLRAYRPIDRVLETSLSRFLPTYRTPLRTSLLIADLAALGQPVRKQGTMTFTPPCTLPETLGILYVTEGSTLGGTMIADKLEQSLARIPRQALSFFSLGGSGSPSLWEKFLVIFPSDPDSHDFSQELLRGATRTFRHFLDVFSSRDSTARPEDPQTTCLSDHHLADSLSP